MPNIRHLLSNHAEYSPSSRILVSTLAVYATAVRPMFPCPLTDWLCKHEQAERKAFRTENQQMRWGLARRKCCLFFSFVHKERICMARTLLRLCRMHLIAAVHRFGVGRGTEFALHLARRAVVVEEALHCACVLAGKTSSSARVLPCHAVRCSLLQSVAVGCSQTLVCASVCSYRH